MTDPSSILDKAKALKNADQDQLLLDMSRGTIVTTLIGASVGLVIGYNRKYNLLMSAIVGATLTGLASNFFIKRK